MPTSLYAKLHRRFAQRPTGAERRAVMLGRRAEVKRGLPAGWLDRAVEAKEGTSPGRVAVVGGGFAGLSSAYWLAQARFDVHVFEARDRVGGRVHTLRDFCPGRLIEGGAELIGLNHALWIAFAELFGLSFCVVTPEDDVDHLGLEMPLHLKGERLSRAETEKIWTEMDDAVQALDVPARSVHPYRPWDSPQAASLDERLLSDWLDGLGPSAMCRAALEAQFADNNAEPTNRQSLLANLALVRGGGLKRFWTESEMFRCATGNDSLAAALRDWLVSNGGSVSLGTPVERIVISESDVHVETAAGPDAFDFAILAIPPSLWSDRLAIDPPIPDEYRMQMGPAVKFLSSVGERFWLGRRLSASGLDDRVGETWEGTDNQTVLDGQGIELTVFAGGDAARRALDSADPAAWYAKGLDTLFPGYSARRASTRFMAWPREEWTGGGYSCPSPGQVTTIGPLLARPYHERLFFAGEHSCPAFFGFMEGALESGLLAAGRVCDAVGIGSSEAVEATLLAAAEVQP